MSRYLILLFLNIPFIALSMISALTRYKLHKSTIKHLAIELFAWLIVFFGLASAESIYNWLFQHNMTKTEPLSLFDVIQITAIVIIFYLANRSHTRIEALEKRIQDLHQELSIILSVKEK